MKKRVTTVLFLLLLLPGTLAASDDVEALFDKALDHLLRTGYMGDTSAAERYLQAVLQEQPNHLEASWQLITIQLGRLRNTSLSGRAAGLLLIAPLFEDLAEAAQESNQEAFLHFTTAVYADYYAAYERGLSEIEKALALEPQSPRYLMAKGKLLVAYGSWTGRDQNIEAGIRLLYRAKELSKTHPNPYALPRHYDFQLAWGLSQLSQPRSKEVVEHYLSFLEQSEESIPYAYAWNNVSIAYRQLGQCEKAKEAAQNALSVMEFGNAESNKRYAEFCIEMQKMGTLEQASQETPDLTIASTKTEPTPPTESERPETEERDELVVAAMRVQEDPKETPVQADPRETPVQTDSRILDLADQLLAAVSRARGLKVKRPITKVFAKRKEIEVRLLRVTDELNPPQQLEFDGKLLFQLGLLPRNYDLAGSLREAALLSTTSFYDPQTKMLYIADSLEEEQGAELATSLVLNLAYALQDQHFGAHPSLARVEGNDDATGARLAVITGDALAVMLAYSARSSRPTSLENRDVRRFFRLLLEEQMGEDVPEALKEITLFPATFGFSFVQFYLKWNGWEGAARLYSDFPRSSEQIMHPEKYAGFRDDPTEVEVQTPPEILSAPWKRVYSNTLGEFILYLVLKEFITEQKAKWGAQGWDGDRIELFENPTNRALAFVLRSVWDSDTEASQFSQAYSSLIDKKYPGAQLIHVGEGHQPGERELQWVSGNNRIILRLNGTRVEIIEVEGS